MAKVGELNHREALFVQEYLIDQNGTRSSKAAGYSHKSDLAHAQAASKMLRHPKIRRAIDKVLKARERAAQFRAEDVLIRLKEISDADILQCYNKDGTLKPLHRIPKHVRKAIAGVETKEIKSSTGKLIGYTKKLKFWDKTKALELSGKHLKLFTEKVESTGANGAPLHPDPVVVVLPAKDSK